MNPAHQRILIVDDVPSNLTVLLDFLQEAGFKVFVAEDGESALQQLAFSHPDIVLLDVMMPRLDGFETCRRIKADPRHRSTPVIFMTALNEQVDKLRGFEAGAVDYISKPLFPAEVMARVNAHLELHALQRELRERNEALDREVQRRVNAEDRLRNSLDRAVLVVDEAEGEILFSTLRAAELLREYGAGGDGARLPAVLASTDRTRLGVLPHPRTPGRELRARRFFEPDAADCSMILLEEAGNTPGAASLVVLGLTPREAEILFWVAQGKANAEVATILNTAPNTVKKHLQNIMPKLGVETRLAAALRANEVLGARP